MGTTLICSKVPEDHQAFVDDAIRADQAMKRSGFGYAAADVHRYLEAKIHGRTTRRPKPLRWRRG